jgi:hypothetical protein
MDCWDWCDLLVMAVFIGAGVVLFLVAVGIIPS